MKDFLKDIRKNFRENLFFYSLVSFFSIFTFILMIQEISSSKPILTNIIILILAIPFSFYFGYILTAIFFLLIVYPLGIFFALLYSIFSEMFKGKK